MSAQPFAPARGRTVVTVAVVTGVLGWAALQWWEDSGGSPVPLPWTAVVGTAALAVVVLVTGLPVRRWVQGSRDQPLDPIRAARTVVLAKAAAYGGALLAGWYAAQALVVLPEVVGARRARLVLALVAAVCAVAVSVAGLVVQQWCRVPPGDEDSAR